MSAHQHPRQVARLPVAAVVLALAVTTTNALGQTCGSLETYAWMLGKWQTNVETTVFTERWDAAADGSMTGYAESRSSETGESSSST